MKFNKKIICIFLVILIPLLILLLENKESFSLGGKFSKLRSMMPGRPRRPGMPRRPSMPRRPGRLSMPRRPGRLSMPSRPRILSRQNASNTTSATNGTRSTNPLGNEGPGPVSLSAISSSPPSSPPSSQSRLSRFSSMGTKIDIMSALSRIRVQNRSTTSGKGGGAFALSSRGKYFSGS